MSLHVQMSLHMSLHVHPREESEVWSGISGNEVTAATWKKGAADSIRARAESKRHGGLSAEQKQALEQADPEAAHGRTTSKDPPQRQTTKDSLPVPAAGPSSSLAMQLGRIGVGFFFRGGIHYTSI